MTVKGLFKVGELNSKLKLCCFLLLFSSASYGGQFCLLAAENYYEQLYCEVKAQGQGKRLPSFYDFQNNNEQTQAFLLKRPAAKLGIQVVLPKLKTEPKSRPKRKPQYSTPRDSIIADQKPVDNRGSEKFPVGGTSQVNPFDHCIFQPREIQCAGISYKLVGNVSNRKLSKGVLDQSNKMNIPRYRIASSDSEAVAEYLGSAYEQYISKMLEIGLGGSTFSYAKFVYLYEDVSGKGIDFSQRFETMFGYLKKDKQNLAVSEKLPDSTYVKKERCDWLKTKVIVCDGGKGGGQKNYVYLAN